jgi:hypothetical protein
MARKKLPPTPLPPKALTAPAPEHDAARGAFLEDLVTGGVVSGTPFKRLVRSILDQYGETHRLKRAEVEDAVRRAEENMRVELSASSAHQRAVTARQLMSLRDRLFQSAMTTTKPMIFARAAARHFVASERLSQLFGWNEPERLRIEVVGSSERLKKVLEDFDDEEYTRIAAEEEEKDRQLGVLREAAGLPAQTPFAVRCEE